MKSLFWIIPIISCSVVNTKFNFDENAKYVVKLSNKVVLDEGHDPLGSYIIRGNKNQKYICDLSLSNKTQEIQPKSSSLNDTVIQPKDMVSKFNEKCVIFTLSYWNYSICFGRNITQYHQNEDGKIVGKNFFKLGNYESDKTWTKQELEASDLKKELYHSQYYSKGDKCDLKGSRKSTELRFHCQPNVDLEVVTQYEQLGCNYTFLILTSAVCQYPSFHPKSVNEAEVIKCSPYLPKISYDLFNAKNPDDKPPNTKPTVYSVKLPIKTSDTEKDLTMKILESVPDLPEELKKILASKKEVQILTPPESPLEESFEKDVDLMAVTKKIILEQDHNGDMAIRYRFVYNSKFDFKKLLSKARGMNDQILSRPDLAKMIRDSRNTLNFKNFENENNFDPDDVDSLFEQKIDEKEHN